MAESLIMMGLVLLAIEIAVLGFSTFVLSFVGLAAVITGAFIYLGIIPESMLSALLSIGIVTAVLAVFLWRPMKSWQGKVEQKKVSSDLVGHSFVLNENVGPGLSPRYRYSGIDWTLLSNQALSAGTTVEVTEVAVGQFTVQAKPAHPDSD